MRANTDKKQGKMSRRFGTFSFRTAAFARRVFLTRCKLTREPGCIGKIMTLATTCNSRFAGSIPRLTGIFTGKTHKNNSSTPTSGSHNSLVRTLIHVNFIPLESRRRELSDDMLHDPFLAPEGLQNCPKKSGQKRVRTRKSRKIQWGLAWRIRTPRGIRTGPCRAARDGPARGVHALLGSLSVRIGVDKGFWGL